MNYVKADDVLPEELVYEIQKYVQGRTLYIPKPKAAYKKWGACSGARAYINERNRSIKADFSNGETIEKLTNKYYLSEDTIKKIIYSR